jgi:solute carrier family 25 folate transporter 32
MGNILYFSLSFSHNNNSYNSIKAYMTNGNDANKLGPGRHMLAAAEAGIMTLALTNPLWVIKTRLCLQYGNLDKLALPAYKRYDGMMDAFRKVYRYLFFFFFIHVCIC